jgi:hypothetical protein
LSPKVVKAPAVSHSRRVHPWQQKLGRPPIVSTISLPLPKGHYGAGTIPWMPLAARILFGFAVDVER